MFCPYCGTKLPDTARFCTACGQRIPTRTGASSQPNGPLASPEGAAAAPEEKSTGSSLRTASDNEPSQAEVMQAVSSSEPSEVQLQSGDLASQVEEVRATTKRRMPLFLLVVLVALGVAGAALAATVTWKYVIAPALGQRQEAPAAVTEQTAPEASATPEATAAAGNTNAQQAVYNDILSEYKAAQDRGWTLEEGDNQSLKNLIEGRRLHPQNSTSDAIPWADDGAAVYAFYHLDGSDEPALLIGTLSNSGRKTSLVAVYTSDGDKAIDDESISSIAMSFDIWSVSDRGQIVGGSHLFKDNDDPRSHGGITYLRVENGTLESYETYAVYQATTSDKATYRLLTGDKSAPEISEEEFLAIHPEQDAADIVWHPLSDFKPAR